MNGVFIDDRLFIGLLLALMVLIIGEGILIYIGVNLMSTGQTAAQALADLQNAVASIQTGVTALQAVDAQIDAAVTAVQQALTNAGVAPSAIEAVVAQLTAIQTSVGTVTTDLTNQANTLNPPAAPAPQAQAKKG